MHDPNSGQADVFGRGRLEYSLSERSATITNPSFEANTGEKWEITALKGKAILGDSAVGKTSAFYGLNGKLTSCTDSIPDYHFEFSEVKRSGANTAKSNGGRRPIAATRNDTIRIAMPGRRRLNEARYAPSKADCTMLSETPRLLA